MRIVVYVLAILFVAMLATLYTIDNPGYVLLAWAPWSVEMSLALFIPLSLLAFLLLYLLLYLWVRVWRIPREVSRWRRRRQTRAALGALHEGLTKVTEANWVEAEAKLLASMRNSDAPLLNYLGAAGASQGQGNLEKRDEYLALAHKRSPQNYLSIGMVQAFLQFQARQYEQALATITELRTLAPKHKPVLQLLAHVYRELRDWTGLADLVPDLRRHFSLGEAEIGALELQAHRELLKLSLPSGSLNVLRRAWNAVPKALRKNPTLIAIYTRQLIRQGEMNEAEALLRAAIEEQWDEPLVELYGHARSDRVAEQLDTAEAWLSVRASDASLLLTLGRLAIYNEIEGKARAFLEKAIALQESAEAYEVYGRLLEKLGEPDNALVAYRAGLEAHAAVRGIAPGIPAPKAPPERPRLVR